jgi:hypothetical protein
MDIYYSPSTPGFFSTVIFRKDQLPSDAVKISLELHQSLMEGASRGKLISIDGDGLPFLEDVPDSPIVVSHAQIDAERDRRIDAGVTFNEVLYQSKTTDRENIAGAAQMAFMAVVGGVQPGNLRWSNPDQDFAWICAENTLVPMDAQTVVDFGRAAALRKSELIHAGRALKDLPEIPENFTDDIWWPA